MTRVLTGVGSIGEKSGEVFRSAKSNWFFEEGRLAGYRLQSNWKASAVCSASAQKDRRERLTYQITQTLDHDPKLIVTQVSFPACGTHPSPRVDYRAPREDKE